MGDQRNNHALAMLMRIKITCGGWGESVFMSALTRDFSFASCYFVPVLLRHRILSFIEGKVLSILTTLNLRAVICIP